MPETHSFTIYGRTFTVLARFDGPGHMDAANAYMTANPGTGLLAYINTQNGNLWPTEKDGQAIIASLSDKGVKCLPPT